MESKPALAGAEPAKIKKYNADPEKECEHSYTTETKVLTATSWFRKAEVLAAIVYCKSCGNLASSCRIAV